MKFYHIVMVYEKGFNCKKQQNRNIGDEKISSAAFNKNNRLFPESTNLSSLSSSDDRFSSLSTSAMIARGEVPESHRRVADNYMVIKKVYGSPVVRLKITNQERNLLARYDFNPLEYSTIKQINEELAFLKRWAFSFDNTLKHDADELIQIRAKELKYLAASRYVNISNEMYNGYQALERYFEEISKYRP